MAEYQTDIRYNEHSEDGTIVTKCVTLFGPEVFTYCSDGVIVFRFDDGEHSDAGFVCSVASFVNMRSEMINKREYGC